MKKLLIALLPLTFLASRGLSQEITLPSRNLTLRQCVEVAIQNNQDVLLGETQMQSARIDWNQSRMNQLPDLNLNGQAGLQQGRSIDPFTNTYINQSLRYSSYNANSNVVLFNGGSLTNTVRQNRLGYESSRLNWQQLKDNLTLNVILAYLAVLRSQDQLTQAERQLEYSRKQLVRNEVLNREGAVAPDEYTNIKGQFDNDRLAIITAVNSLKTSRINLCQLMNVEYREDLTVERMDSEEIMGDYTGTPGEIFQETLQQFALVKVVDLQRRSALSALKASRGALFPTLSVGGNLNTNFSSLARNNIFLGNSFQAGTNYVVVNGNNTPVMEQVSNFDVQKIGYGRQLNNNLSNSVGLVLNVPLFNRWRQRNLVQRAVIQLKNAEINQRTTNVQLQQQVEQSHANLVAARDRYEALLDQVKAYTESFRIAEIKFNEGVLNAVEYTLARNFMDQANINLITARYDFVLRTKILDYYRGRKLW